MTTNTTTNFSTHSISMESAKQILDFSSKPQPDITTKWEVNAQNIGLPPHFSDPAELYKYRQVKTFELPSCGVMNRQLIQQMGTQLVLSETKDGVCYDHLMGLIRSSFSPLDMGSLLLDYHEHTLLASVLKTTKELMYSCPVSRYTAKLQNICLTIAEALHHVQADDLNTLDEYFSIITSYNAFRRTTKSPYLITFVEKAEAPAQFCGKRRKNKSPSPPSTPVTSVPAKTTSLADLVSNDDKLLLATMTDNSEIRPVSKYLRHLYDPDHEDNSSPEYVAWSAENPDNYISITSDDIEYNEVRRAFFQAPPANISSCPLIDKTSSGKTIKRFRSNSVCDFELSARPKALIKKWQDQRKPVLPTTPMEFRPNIVNPTPLTTDPSTDYSDPTIWDSCPSSRGMCGWHALMRAYNNCQFKDDKVKGVYAFVKLVGEKLLEYETSPDHISPAGYILAGEAKEKKMAIRDLILAYVDISEASPRWLREFQVSLEFAMAVVWTLGINCVIKAPAALVHFNFRVRHKSFIPRTIKLEAGMTGGHWYITKPGVAPPPDIFDFGSTGFSSPSKQAYSNLPLKRYSDNAYPGPYWPADAVKSYGLRTMKHSQSTDLRYPLPAEHKTIMVPKPTIPVDDTKIELPSPPVTNPGDSDVEEEDDDPLIANVEDLIDSAPEPPTGGPVTNDSPLDPDMNDPAVMTMETGTQAVFQEIFDMTTNTLKSTAGLLHRSISFAMPIVSIVSAIYNLVRLIHTGQWIWMDIAVNISNLALAAMGLYTAIWNELNIKNLFKYLIRAGELQFGVRMCGLSTYTTCFKALAVVVGGSLVAAGKINPNKVSGTVALANATGDFTKDITNTVAGWMGYDLTGKSATDELIMSKATELQSYYDVPAASWKGDFITTVNQSVNEVKRSLNTYASMGSSAAVSHLMKILAEVEKRLSNLNAEWRSRADRPVPVGLYLWSTQGGLGKTAFVRYMSDMLTKMITGFQDGVYSLSSTSAHAPLYHGEDVIFMDEVGAVNITDYTKSPICRLNDIISNNPTPAPSAGLEGKEQILKPRLVVCASNKRLDLIDTGMQMEAQDALATRLDCWEFQDPNFDDTRENFRQNQPHRKADYSHIRFEKYDPVTNKTRHITANQLIRRVAERICQNHEAFMTRTTNTQKMNVTPFNYRGQVADITIPKMCAADSPKITVCVSGKPGVGKSTSIRPLLVTAARQLGVNFWEFGKGHLRTNPNATRGVQSDDIVLFDDTFNFNNEEGQDLFLNVYNELPAFTKIIVITNSGPKRSIFDYRRYFCDDYDPVDVMVPGIARRLGWVSEPDSLWLVKTSYSFVDRLHQVYPIQQLFDHWAKGITRSAFPMKYEKLPEPLPFTSREADIWIEIPDDNGLSTAAILRQIVGGSSARVRVFAAKNFAGRNIDSSSLGTLMRKLCFDISRDKTMQDPKIFVKVGERVHMYDGVGYYIGTEHQSLVYHPDSCELVWGAESITMDKAKVQSIFNRDLKAFTDVGGQWYHMLACEQDRDTKVWKTIIKQFPPDTESWWAWSKRHFTMAGVKAWNMIKEYPYHATALMVLMFIVAYMFANWLKGDNMTKLKDSEADFQCSTCTYVSGTVIWDPECPYAPNMCGRRSRKQRREAQTFVTYGGKRRNVDSGQDSARDDVLVHNAYSKLAQEDNFTRSKNKVRMRYADSDYNVSYGWRNGNLELMIEAAADEMCANSSPFGDRAVKLYADEFVLYGQLVDSWLIRYPAHLHCYLRGSQQITFTRDSRTYVVQNFYRDDVNDVAYGKVTDGDVVTPISGIKSIEKDLLPASVFPEIRNVYVVDPAGQQPIYHMPAKFEVMCSEPVRTQQGMIFGKAVLVNMASVAVPYLSPGNCGGICYVERMNKKYMVGMFSAIGGSRKTAYFSSITQDEYYNMLGQLSEMCVGTATKYDPAGYYLSNNHPPRPIFTPPELSRHMFNREEAPLQLDRGYKTIAHVSNNLIPIDQAVKRKPIKNLHFAPLFGVPKRPVPTKADIERDYADLIPADLRGNKHAEMVRLSKGAVVEADPERRILDICQQMRAAAAQFGQYWNHRAGIKDYTPLTKEDAIWGNNTIDGLDLSTSTGASFALIHPNATVKSTIFGERGEYKGKAGEHAKRLIDDQWEMLKEGKELVLPNSMSLKSELLVVEKLHKKRLVTIVDPITCVNLRRLLFPLQKIFTSLGPVSPFQVAMDPLLDFNGLARKGKSYDEAVDIDVSAFDLTIDHEMMVCAGIVVTHMVKAGPTLAKMIKTATQIMSNAPTLVGTTLCSRDGNMPSGIPCTSFIDAIMSALMIFFSWMHFRNWNANIEEFYADNFTYNCGDDTLWFRNAKQNNVTPNAAAEFIRTYLHMKVTDGVKGEDDITGKHIEQVRFVSREFLPHPTMKHFYVGRLKTESIAGALTYSEASDPVELKNTIVSYAVEVALYGDEKYQQYVDLVRQYDENIELPRRCVVLNELKDRIASASNRKLLNESDTISITVPLTKLSRPSTTLSANDLLSRTIQKRKDEKISAPIAYMGYKALLKDVKSRFITGAPISGRLISDTITAIRDNWNPAWISECSWISTTGEYVQTALPAQDDGPAHWFLIISYLGGPTMPFFAKRVDQATIPRKSATTRPVYYYVLWAMVQNRSAEERYRILKMYGTGIGSMSHSPEGSDQVDSLFPVRGFKVEYDDLIGDFPGETLSVSERSAQLLQGAQICPGHGYVETGRNDTPPVSRTTRSCIDCFYQTRATREGPLSHSPTHGGSDIQGVDQKPRMCASDKKTPVAAPREVQGKRVQVPRRRPQLLASEDQRNRLNGETTDSVMSGLQDDTRGDNGKNQGPMSGFTSPGMLSSSSSCVIGSIGGVDLFNGQPEIAAPPSVNDCLPTVDELLEAYQRDKERKTTRTSRVVDRDATFCSAPTTTAAPPDAVPSAGGGPVTSNPIPENMQPSTLEGSALANSEMLAFGAGISDSATILSNQGGVTNETTYANLTQTGIDKTLFTASGNWMYKEIVYIPSATKQGTVLWSARVNPWNDQILNPATKVIADNHRRFRGWMGAKFEVTGNAALLGLVKVAYIPATAKNMLINQTNIDNFSPVEFAVNTAGSGVLEYTPTIEGGAVTGIYRADGVDKDYGRIVMIAATDIYNTLTATNAVLQARISFKQHSQGFYDIPDFLFPGQSDNALSQAGLDLGEGFRSASVAGDGQYYDSADYTENGFDADNDILPIELIPGTNQVRALIAPTLDTARFGLYAGAKVNANAPNINLDEPVSYLTGMCDFTIQRTLDGTVTVGSGGDFNAELSRQLNENPEITYSNVFIQGSPSQPAIGVMQNEPSVPTVYANLNAITNFQAVFQRRQQYHAGPNDTFVPASVGVYGVVGMVHTNELYIVGQNQGVKYPYDGSADSRIVVDGVPLATQGRTIDGGAPPSWMSVYVVDEQTIVPAVAPAVTGTTIVPGRAHATAMVRAVRLLESQGAGSITTSLSDQSGTIILNVLRNRLGMFVPRGTLPEYWSLATEFDNLKQTHTVNSIDFPPLPVGDSRAVVNRKVSSNFKTAAIGSTTATMMMDEEEIKLLNSPNVTKRGRRVDRAGKFCAAVTASTSTRGMATQTTKSTDNKATWMNRPTKTASTQISTPNPGMGSANMSSLGSGTAGAMVNAGSGAVGGIFAAIMHGNQIKHEQQLQADSIAHSQWTIDRNVNQEQWKTVNQGINNVDMARIAAVRDVNVAKVNAATELNINRQNLAYKMANLNTQAMRRVGLPGQVFGQANAGPFKIGALDLNVIQPRLGHWNETTPPVHVLDEAVDGSWHYINSEFDNIEDANKAAHEKTLVTMPEGLKPDFSKGPLSGMQRDIKAEENNDKIIGEWIAQGGDIRVLYANEWARKSLGRMGVGIFPGAHAPAALPSAVSQ